MKYVDGFVIPLPKKNVATYRKMAKKASKIWMEHGALEYRECVADQLDVPDDKGNKWAPFKKTLKLKPSETMIFAYIVYRSRAHRDKVNALVMTDPRIAKMMEAQEMPFDVKRMNMAGFKSIVEA